MLLLMPWSHLAAFYLHILMSLDLAAFLSILDCVVCFLMCGKLYIFYHIARRTNPSPSAIVLIIPRCSFGDFNWTPILGNSVQMKNRESSTQTVGMQNKNILPYMWSMDWCITDLKVCYVSEGRNNKRERETGDQVWFINVYVSLMLAV